MIEQSGQMTAREREEHNWRVEEFDKQADHAVLIKRLELEQLREQNQAEIKLKELEAKWRTWLRIPIMIIMLPLYILFGIAYIVSMVTKKEMPKRYWELLN